MEACTRLKSLADNDFGCLFNTNSKSVSNIHGDMCEKLKSVLYSFPPCISHSAFFCGLLEGRIVNFVVCLYLQFFFVLCFRFALLF